MDIRQDNPKLHERLVFAEQAQPDPIGNASLFKVCQIFCIVDMSLRVQIPVTDFDGMIEMKIGHEADYTVWHVIASRHWSSSAKHISNQGGVAISSLQGLLPEGLQ